MGHIIKQGFHNEKLTFSYNVSVDSEGIFRTTLPEPVVLKLEHAGIKLGINRMGNKGLFTAPTLKELKEQIASTCNKFSQKKSLGKKIIVRYQIEIDCTYCKGKKGLYPNGYMQNEAEKTKTDNCNWVNGTQDLHANSHAMYGFQVAFELAEVDTIQFPDGEIKKEYDNVPDDILKNDEGLRWLDSICGMDLNGDSDPLEIEYTDEVGLFFRNLITQIFQLNENFKRVFGDTVDLSKVDLSKLLSSGNLLAEHKEEK